MGVIGVLNLRTLCSALSAVCAALALPSVSAASSPAGVPRPVVRAAPVQGLSAARADRPDPISRHQAAASAPTASVPLPVGGWQALGPAPTGPTKLAGGLNVGTTSAGRITSLAVIPTGSHAGRLVAGSAGGGIWISDDNGVTWTPQTDSAADLAIGALTVDPTNPDHLIAGTGEDNQCGDCFPGDGILNSTDGATTWTLQNPGGVFSGLKVGEVAIDPNNSSHEFAATSGGLYVTTDGGSHWALPTDASYATVAGTGRVDSVALDPSTNPSTVYIGGAGTGSSPVAKSTDGGTTWAAASTGIAAPGAYPVVKLAIAKSSPSTLYVSVGSDSPAAVYKSTNSASSWSQLTNAPDYTGSGYAYGSGSGDQGWYDNTIAVDPTNPGHVLLGGVTVVESMDGGSTWSNVNGQSFFGYGTNKFHPDQHALLFTSNASSIWVGDDGGVFHYTPSSSTVTPANGNLGITQFYFGFNEVGGTVLGGTQDNASAETSSPTLSTWTGVWSGDGGPSAITIGDPSLRFIEADGNLYNTTDAFGAESRPTDITPNSGYANNGLFTPPMIVIPNAITPTSPTVFYGGSSLWRTTDPGDSFPSWSSVASVSGGKVSAIAASPSDPRVVYVGFNNGTIMVSRDGGQTFTALAPETDSGSDLFVTGLSVNPTNPYGITASFSYNDTRYKTPSYPHVEQYTWSGVAGSEAAGTWTSITGNLPTAAVSHVIYQTGPESGALIAATDLGVYATAIPNGSSTTWTQVGTGLPNVQVQDLYIDAANPAKLYVLTHGRGAWLLQTPAPQNTSPPTISGTALQGQTLNLTQGTWSNGSATISDHWQECDGSGASCQDIPGATGQSYTLTPAVAHHTIRVQETDTWLGGGLTSTSNPTAVVPPLPPVNLTAPTITGTPQDGHVLSASTGSWSSPDTLRYSYQWQRCSSTGTSCTAVTGASRSSYTLTSTDVTHKITVIVTATDQEAQTKQASATPTAPVAKPPPPHNVSLPVISGTAARARTLTATRGSWTSPDRLTFSYQWQRCSTTGTACTRIAGASHSYYRLASADVGHKVTIVITAADPEKQSTHATGKPVGPVH